MEWHNLGCFVLLERVIKIQCLPIVSKHSTDNLSIVIIPGVVTDGSPDVVKQYFQASFYTSTS